MPVPIYRFSTIKLPIRERFDAWRADSSPLFAFSPPKDGCIAYDSEVAIARLGDMIFGEASWLCPEQRVSQAIHRAPRRIRSDGVDHYYLRLQRDAGFHVDSGASSSRISSGKFCLLDMASQFALHITTGNSLFIVVPRELLPDYVATRHGHTVDGGLGILLSDYFDSLSKNSGHLSHTDTPHVRDASLNMLRACLAPSPDTVARASSELDTLLKERVSAYIASHLLDRELSPDLICQKIGISRSKLYRIFEETGGIARQIQRKRLLRIRGILENPYIPRARISEVAWRNGFTSEKRFSRAYKAEFGHAPREAFCAHQQQLKPDDIDEISNNENPRVSFREWMYQPR